jgi:predicted metalloprotease
MKWTPGRRSQNLEDRRGDSRGPMRAGLPGLRLPMGRGGRFSITGLLIILGLVWLLGGDPLALLFGGGGMGGSTVQVPGSDPFGVAPERTGPVTSSPAEERMVEFVSFVLDDAQAVWKQLLPGYQDARLVLFRDGVESACGFAQTAVGPFYCPGDHRVYIDLAFFEELHRRFGAPGDFAQAYVLAHELGHHVQRLIGIEEQVRRAQQASPGAANDLSVRMELQADCFAGVWGHSTSRRDLLEAGDVDEGLAAAAAVGDDRIQSMSGGRISPERWTHGSSQQRAEWFRRGFDTGDPNACDTFGSAG